MSRELAIPERGGLAAFNPSGHGLPPISLPRIVVLQALSAEVSRTEDKLPVGVFFNRLTKEVVSDISDPQDPRYGKAITVIPLSYFPSRIRIELGAGLVCRSRDMETADMEGGETYKGETTNVCSSCKLKDWPRERKAKGDKLKDAELKKGPACNVVENFPALWVQPGVTPEDYEILLLSFSRTSAQAARDLRGIWTMSGKPWYAFKYQVNVRQAQGGPQNTTYFKQEIKRAGKASAEEQERAHEILGRLSSQTIDVEGGEEADLVPEVSGEKESTEAVHEQKF